MIINSPKNGKIGKDGIDGVTPHIGTNGNWFLGESDTGVVAKAQSNTTIVSITLLASDWSADNNTQTVSCTGISADEASQNIDISPALEDRSKYMNARIICSGFAEDSLTFRADIIPAENIVVYVAIEEAGSISNDVYSTEETVIGTWIDGKPIYRKVVLGVTSNGLNLTNNNSIDHMVTHYGTFMHSVGLVNIPYALQVQHYIDCIKPINTNDIFIECAGYEGFSFTITLEYTKTTDTATIEIPSATALTDAYDEGVNEA